MNAKTAAPVRMCKCNSCGHLYPNGLVGDNCIQMIPDKKFTPQKGVEYFLVSCKGKIILTNGQKFREQHGFTLTFRRNMKRQGLDLNELSDSMNEYRAIRRKRQKALRKQQQDKHVLKRAARGSGGKRQKSEPLKT